MSTESEDETPQKRAIFLKPYHVDPTATWRRHLNLFLAVALAMICLPFGFFYALTTPYLIVPLATPLAVLLGMIIWALPNMERPPLKSIETLFFVFFAAVIMWPNYLAISLPGLPWITVLRLFGFPMAFLFAVSLSSSPAYRRDLMDIQETMPALWKITAIIFALQIITLPFSPDTQVSVQKIIVWQVNLTAVFFISSYVFSKEGRAERWTYVLLAMCLAISTIGIVEYMERRVLWAGHIPSFLKVETDSVNSILSGATRSATGVYRTKATFSTPLGMAEFLALSMPFVIHLMMGRYRLITRLIAAASLPIMVHAVILTDSRLGVVGTIMSFLLYFMFWAVLRWRRNRSDLLAPAILFASPAVVVATVMATFFVRRLRLMVWGGGAQAASNEGRADQLDKGLPMVLKNPIGHGPGQAAETLGHHGGGGVLTIDNYYLAIGLEYGVVGFVAFYGMFILAGYQAGKRAITMSGSGPREFDLFVPLTVSLANFIVIKSVFSQQDNHPIVFMMLGMIVALAYRLNQRTKAA